MLTETDARDVTTTDADGSFRLTVRPASEFTCPAGVAHAPNYSLLVEMCKGVVTLSRCGPARGVDNDFRTMPTKARPNAYYLDRCMTGPSLCCTLDCGVLIPRVRQLTAQKRPAVLNADGQPRSRAAVMRAPQQDTAAAASSASIAAAMRAMRT